MGGEALRAREQVTKTGAEQKAQRGQRALSGLSVQSQGLGTVAEGAKRDQEALRRREQPGWTRADGQSPGAGLWPDPGLPGVGGKPGVAHRRGVTSSPQAPYPSPRPGGQVSLIALRLLSPPEPLTLGSGGDPIMLRARERARSASALPARGAWLGGVLLVLRRGGFWPPAAQCARACPEPVVIGRGSDSVIARAACSPWQSVPLFGTKDGDADCRASVPTGSQ